MPKYLKSFLTLVIILGVGLSIYSIVKQSQQQDIEVAIPYKGIDSNNIAILVNQSDPLSIKTAELYSQLRNIPRKHIFYVDFPQESKISPYEFQKEYLKIIRQVPQEVEGFVATWQKPYRVGCMSITSALAFGFDKKWCKQAKKGCFKTANNPYFASNTNTPWKDLKMRPSMLLTSTGFDNIEALIKRGVESDGTRPKGKAVLMRTKDSRRSSRWPIFKEFSENFVYNPLLDVFYIDASTPEEKDYLENQESVMFYQTGRVQVPNIETNEYLPGAIADHLTSFGGKGSSRSGQMKIYRWLEAGVTGSYGTVVEPCNFIEKFPNPAVLIPNYLKGEALIESYWKSVKQPGEGLFIGEPLARPYDLHSVSFLSGHLKVLTNRLEVGKKYELLEWVDEDQQYRPIDARFIRTGNHTHVISARNVESKKLLVRQVKN